MLDITKQHADAYRRALGIDAEESIGCIRQLHKMAEDMMNNMSMQAHFIMQPEMVIVLAICGHIGDMVKRLEKRIEALEPPKAVKKVTRPKVVSKKKSSKKPESATVG